MKNSGIRAIFNSKCTVFTSRELGLVWGISNQAYLKTRIEYYISNGYLFRICHGLYSKEKDSFDQLEAANKLRSPSYVSLETVLAREGVIFQQYSSVFLVSYATKTVTNKAGEFIYKKIKDSILFDKTGVIIGQNYSIASKERAFLDAVYLYKDYHFDNLRHIDWDKAEDIAHIYGSKALLKRLEVYKEDAKPV
jgi:hypothetical protein